MLSQGKFDKQSLVVPEPWQISLNPFRLLKSDLWTGMSNCAYATEGSGAIAVEAGRVNTTLPHISK